MIPLITIALCFLASFLVLGSGAFLTGIVWITISWEKYRGFHTVKYIFEERFLFETLIFGMCPPITCCLVTFLQQSGVTGKSKHRRICFGVSPLRNGVVSFLNPEGVFSRFIKTSTSPKFIDL